MNTVTIESNGQLTVDAGASLMIYDYLEGFFAENVILNGTLVVMGEKLAANDSDKSLITEFPAPQGPRQLWRW